MNSLCGSIEELPTKLLGFGTFKVRCESRLLSILLYLRRATEGYMSEKHGTEESYLVFSNWPIWFGFLSFLSTLLDRTTMTQLQKTGT